MHEYIFVLKEFIAHKCTLKRYISSSNETTRIPFVTYLKFLLVQTSRIFFLYCTLGAAELL